MILLAASSTNKKLVHHNISEVDTSSALTTFLDPKEFKWSLTGASWILETQTYYIIGDDGSFTMAQIGYSNISYVEFTLMKLSSHMQYSLNRWPKTNCQISARYFKSGATTTVSGNADGETSPATTNSSSSDSGKHDVHKFETQTISSSRMKLTDNNLSVTANDTAFISKPNSGADANANHMVYSVDYTMSPDSANSGTPPPFSMKFDFSSQCRPVQVNDGKIHFGANRGDGFIQMKFIPAGRCEGTIKVHESNQEIPFAGQGICLRQFQGVKPHATVKRWNCAYFLEKAGADTLAPRRSLFMIQLECVEGYEGAVIDYGFYFDGSQLHTVTVGGNDISYTKTIVDPDSGYPVPEHFEYRWKGTDFSGSEFVATISSTPVSTAPEGAKSSSRMARIDLFDNLPSFIRTVLQSVTTARPYIYQHFDRDVEASINGEIVVGDFFQEFSFLVGGK